jgi:hypothetical protein
MEQERVSAPIDVLSTNPTPAASVVTHAIHLSLFVIPCPYCAPPMNPVKTLLDFFAEYHVSTL